MSDTNEKVTFTIEPPSAFGGFRDASPYFVVIPISNSSAIVRLAKSIENEFKPGDQLGLSIITNNGQIPHRSEVYIVIVEKQHQGLDHDSFNPLLPHLNNRETIPVEDGETSTKEQEQVEVTEMTPKESAQQKTTMYAVIVVIFFVIIIPVSVIGKNDY